jgi:Prolyl oligopeptidase family
MKHHPVAVSMWSIFCCTFMSPAVPRDMALVDLLRVEGIGHVAFDPAGNRVVFERIPGYGSRANYGVEITEPRYSGQLYVVELNRESPPRPLVDRGQETYEGMWMAGFSPKGSRLAVAWLENGTAHMGAYDFETNTLVKFPFTPDLGFLTFTALDPVWLSEDELVMAALPPGQQPIMTGTRQAAARSLAHEWEEAWRGSKPTASVIRSYAGTPPHAMQSGTLLRISARTGAITPLAEGRFLDLMVSADKRLLVASQIGERRQYDATKTQDGSNGLVGFYRHEAVIFDLTVRQAPASLCPGLDVADGSFVWNTGSDGLTFFAWPEGQSRNNGVFYLVNAAHRRCRAIPHVGLDLITSDFRVGPRQAVPFAAGLAVPARRASDPKAAPAFTETWNDSRRSDWYWLESGSTSRNLTSALNDVSTTLVSATRQALYLQAGGNLWRITPRGAAVALTATSAERVDTAFLVQDSIVVQFAGKSRAVWILDMPSGEIRHRIDLAQHPGSIIEAIAPQSGAVVLREKDDVAQRLTLVQRGGQKHDIWTYNAHLANVQMPRRVVLHYTVAEGRQMSAAVYLPNDLIPARRVPTIVNVYPGLQSNHEWDNPSPYDIQLYTSLGYAVLYPDAPEELLRTADRNPLGGWSSLVLPAVDALIREGYADRNRFSAYGMSQGSWSVLALISQTTRFKAAISAFGTTDFISAYGTLPMLERLWPDDLLAAGDSYRFEHGYPSIGAPPWDDPRGYLLASPLFGIKQIETPVLLEKSDFDAVGAMEEFDQMFSAMLRLRKEAQYVRYWGEGHGVSSPANIIDEWSRELSWLDKYLDISRDSEGHLVYDGDTAKSRRSSPSWSPERFRELTWFFGSKDQAHQ